MVVRGAKGKPRKLSKSQAQSLLARAWLEFSDNWGMSTMRISRRRFLGNAAAAASLLPLDGARAQSADLDVAIVGGGVAGAYTAWRLGRAQPNLRIRLFEMSDRIGGRLRSVAFPQAPQLVGELGGMRFLEAHRHVFNVVKSLGLPQRGYPVFEAGDRLALRGKSFSYAEAGRPGM